MKRCQKNITLSKEQLEFVKTYHGKMDIGSIAKMLGIGYNKVHNNLRLIGKVKTHKIKVIQMKGYFNEQQFFKQYRY